MAKSTEYKFKHWHSTRGLDTIQAVYAFVMALGLGEVFIGSHDFITAIVHGSKRADNIAFVISLLLLINIILLGIRFFWVPRNLRRIVYIDAFNNKGEPKLKNLGSAYISINWLIIFVHAGLYFILCTEFKFIMFSLASNAQADPSIFSGYYLGHAFLLIINGLWIGSLAKREVGLREKNDRRNGNNEEQSLPGGIIWFRNNLAFSLLAIAPFALLSTCQTAAFECIKQLGIENHGVESVIATSTVMVSSLFNIMTYATAWTGVDSIYNLSLWILVCYLLNSLLDLLTTGDYYIILEEVEWEGKN